MEQIKINIDSANAYIQMSRFAAGEVEEIHAILHVTPMQDLFADQLIRLNQALEALMARPETNGAQPVFMRYFLSDATNQAPLIPATQPCTVSYIQQPPLNGSKVALWIYMQKGTEVNNVNESTVVSHNGYKHIWTMGLTDTSADTSYMQT